MRTLLTTAIILACAVAASAGPAIKIANDSFDFGQTIQHAKVIHTFWIKSVGDEALRITKINPGCGCTKAPLRDSVLAPGDSTALDIIFSTRSFLGKVDKRPYLITNASDEKVYLSISAQLFPEGEKTSPLIISPIVVDVSQFTEKTRQVASFLIENPTDRNFDLKLVDGEGRSFEIKLPDKVKAGESVTGKVRVVDDAVESEFEESITIEINDNERTRFTLPVRRTYRILERDSN